MKIGFLKTRWILITITVFFLFKEGYSQTAIIPDSSDYIEFANGKRFYGKVEVHPTSLGSAYISLNDTGRYQIYDMTSFQIHGIPYKKHEWVEGSGRSAVIRRQILRTIIQGRISIYGSTDLMVKKPNDSYDFFSKGLQEIKKLDYKEIRDAIADNRRSMEILEEADRLQMIRAGLAITGGAMFLYGVYSSFQFAKDDEINVDPMVYCGIGVFLSRLLLKSKIDAVISSAVRDYNQSSVHYFSNNKPAVRHSIQEIGLGISRWGSIAYELNFGWHYLNGDSYSNGFDLFFGFSKPKSDEGIGGKLEKKNYMYSTPNQPATETINQIYIGVGYCYSSFGLSGFVERETVHRFENYRFMYYDNSTSEGFIPLDIEIKYGAGIAAYRRITPVANFVVTPRIYYGILRGLAFGISINIRVGS